METPLNEEEVKVRIILPWLASCGIRPDELRLETTFALRIGRKTVTNENASDRTERARLDILVCRNDRNLLVIEAKRSSAQLTEADRDQAISYALLVKPIAPFALVTNGSEFRLYDSITGDRVEPNESRIADDFTIALPNERRLEALQLFFACSPENLLKFSQIQVAQEHQALCGEATDYGAVYIPSVQVERSELIALVRAFVETEDAAFVLLGDSGMGKTCVMVDVSRRLLQAGYPTLFFRGAMLETDILQSVAQEFEWVFGDTNGAIDSLRRLAANASGRPIVIMIDGLDEWDSPNRVQHLASLIRHSTGAHTRLVISCKTIGWEQFRRVRGSRTGIEAYIHQATQDKPFSAEIPTFTDREFHTAVGRYRKVFGVTGVFEDSALLEAKRNPFLLRLLFQVTASRGGRHVAFDSPQFFEEYLALAIRRTSSPEVASNTLAAVAQALFDGDREWIDEDTVRRALELRANDLILPELFEHGLLFGIGVLGMRRIGFSFGQLRNYVIAFHVRHWPDTAALDFATEVFAMTPMGLRSEALAFYYPFATHEQQAAIDGLLRQNASKYLGFYRTVIQENFARFRSAFSPHTPGEVGFVGELLLGERAIGAYGFRPIGDNDDDILLVPVSSPFRSNRVFLAGANDIHHASSVLGFQAPDVPFEVLVHEVVPQLRKIVEGGFLTDSDTLDLAEEIVVNALKSNRSIFKPLLSATTGEPEYPISLAAVSEAFHREILRRHFNEELVQARIERGEIQTQWLGGLVSYSSSMSRQDHADIEMRVDLAVQQGEVVEPRVHYIELDRLWRRLSRAIEDLRSRGDAIPGPSLPFRYEIDRARTHGENPYRPFKEHCARVLELALRNYRGLVEANFPTLREHFDLYNRMPLRAVLSISPEVLAGNSYGRLYFCETDSSSNEVFVYESNDVHEARHESRTNLQTPKGEEVWRLLSLVSAESFLDGPDGRRLECDHRGSVLRRWVYGWLEREIRTVEKALVTRYGVDRAH